MSNVVSELIAYFRILYCTIACATISNPEADIIAEFTGGDGTEPGWYPDGKVCLAFH